MTDENTYRVVYHVDPQPEGITKERLLEEYGEDSIGACDGVIIHSILGTPGGPGSLSHALISYDGIKKAPMTPEQEFQIWALWAHRLVDTMPKDDNRRRIAEGVHNIILSALKVKRDGKPEA